jgi:hypothetical protein
MNFEIVRNLVFKARFSYSYHTLVEIEQVNIHET